jgi:hypothetical protein
MWLRKCGQIFRLCRILCPEGTIGLSLGFQPQEQGQTRSRPEGAQDVLIGALFGERLHKSETTLLPPPSGRDVFLSVPGFKTPGSVLLSLRDRNPALTSVRKIEAAPRLKQLPAVAIRA